MLIPALKTETNWYIHEISKKHERLSECQYDFKVLGGHLLV